MITKGASSLSWFNKLSAIGPVYLPVNDLLTHSNPTTRKGLKYGICHQQKARMVRGWVGLGTEQEHKVALVLGL